VSALIALAGCLPCLLLLARLRARLDADSLRSAVWATCGLGALSTALVFAYAPLLTMAIGEPATFWTRGLVEAYFLAAVPEEAAKFLVLTAFAAAFGFIRDRRTGVAHGLAAAFGFASVEMLLFATRCGPGAVALRVLTTLPCHAAVGVLMGWLVGDSVAGGAVRPGRFALALTLPVVLHGAYDFPLMVLAHAAVQSGRGAVPLPALVAVGTAVLLGITAAARRVYRSVFPPRDGGEVHDRVLRLAEFAVRRGAVAWALIPLGGTMASVGGWLVGSLLFARPHATAAVTSARPVVTFLYALGGALICFGLAAGFRGIRAKQALRPALQPA
jgi:RsiW-degrading membrane proteinase PrsW (M82 family)